MSRSLSRAAAVADRRVTGLSPAALVELVAELGPRRDARLADRPRRRAVGAGARHRLVFIDRLPATLVHLRHGVTHDVVACWFGVSQSTITRAVGKMRPLLAQRGCTVEGGLRLRTLADVIAHLSASRRLGLLNATEVWVRPPGGPPGRSESVRQELARPLASPRPPPASRHDPARGGRTGLQPGTSPRPDLLRRSPRALAAGTTGWSHRP